MARFTIAPRTRNNIAGRYQVGQVSVSILPLSKNNTGNTSLALASAHTSQTTIPAKVIAGSADDRIELCREYWHDVGIEGYSRTRPFSIIISHDGRR